MLSTTFAHQITLQMAKTIEQVIQQKQFQNAQQKATLGLIIAGNSLVAKHNSFVKQNDITIQQYNVLRILRGNYPNPCTILTIKERMIDRKSDVSRIVERLRKSGLIVRNACAEDRRAVDVVISEKGLALLNQLDPGIKKLMQLGDLTDEEANLLSSLIERIL